MKTSVAILGGTGMLGHAVSSYFNNDPSYITYTSSRINDPNIKRLFYFNVLDERCLENIPRVDYVVNCIGCIKQKQYDTKTFMKINAVFPHVLSCFCSSKNIRLIHVTTDCVFSGNTGFYTEIDEPDCADDYGVSKELGEPSNCMLLRTSVIGEETSREKFSLLEWARSNRDGCIDGYINHVWNGVTNKEYARVCDTIIKEGMYVNGLRHIFSTDTTKYDMLCAINQKYDLNVNVTPIRHADTINRTLRTVHTFNDKLRIRSFKQMISEL